MNKMTAHEEGRDGFFAETGCPYQSDDPRFDAWWDGYYDAKSDTETEECRLPLQGGQQLRR